MFDGGILQFLKNFIEFNQQVDFCAHNLIILYCD